MTMKPETRRLHANFKRPLQQPFVGAYEPISWASASFMFDVGDDNLEFAGRARDALGPSGLEEDPRN